MNNLDNINNINKNGNINQKPIDAYENLKYTYDKFISDMDKNDLSNSPVRYMSELNLVVDLKELAKEKNNESEFKNLSKKEEEIRQKLLEWGLEINSPDDD